MAWDEDKLEVVDRYHADSVDEVKINEGPVVKLVNNLLSRAIKDGAGEIRDKETASIAVQAALTGHLLLSTLHTTGAPETLPRLMEMGIEPYYIREVVGSSWPRGWRGSSVRAARRNIRPTAGC